MDTNEISRTLGRLEGKVDLLIDRFDKVDKRVEAVQRKQWYHTGVLAVLGVMAAKMGLPVPH